MTLPIKKGAKVLLALMNFPLVNILVGLQNCQYLPTYKGYCPLNS